MSEKTPASRQLLNITKALLDDANANNERIRNETIEECAKVVENNIESTDRFELVGMVRALKDK